MAENKARMKYLDVEPEVPKSDIRKEGYLDTTAVVIPEQGAVGLGNMLQDPERKQAFENYDRLRQEYFRDHRPSGLATLWDSPWIPFGMGCTAFSLFYSLSSRKSDRFAFKMLNYRIGWGVFTACGMVGTIFRDKIREDKWVIAAAQERRLDIRKEDMYPYLRSTMKKSIKLPLPPLPDEKQHDQQSQTASAPAS